MPGIGQLADRVSFFRLDGVEDTLLNESTAFAAEPFAVRWCNLVEKSGRERLRSDQQESAVMAVIQLRYDSVVATITHADKAVIDGVDYQIRTVIPDRRERWVDLMVERGTAI